MAYPLEKSIGFKINQTANKINNKFNALLQEYDIAPEQRAALEIIKYEKDVNQTKIANILAKDKTTISRTLTSLEKKGLILKKRINKRTNLIELTLKGEKILDNSSNVVEKFREKITSNLNKDEIEKIVELLEKVALSMEKE